jgi:hypothetical protein
MNMIPGMPPGPLPPEAEKMMMEALKAQVPGLQTQAQLNAFMAAFDALRLHLGHIFSSAPADQKTQSYAALLSSLDVAQKVTDVVERLREVPEAAQAGGAASQFVDPPKQFGEYDTQKQLMMELETIGTYENLATWYEANRKRIDEVVSPPLRNALLDAIRTKRNALKGG